MANLTDDKNNERVVYRERIPVWLWGVFGSLLLLAIGSAFTAYAELQTVVAIVERVEAQVDKLDDRVRANELDSARHQRPSIPLD